MGLQSQLEWILNSLLNRTWSDYLTTWLTSSFCPQISGHDSIWLFHVPWKSQVCSYPLHMPFLCLECCSLSPFWLFLFSVWIISSEKSSLNTASKITPRATRCSTGISSQAFPHLQSSCLCIFFTHLFLSFSNTVSSLRSGTLHLCSLLKEQMSYQGLVSCIPTEVLIVHPLCFLSLLPGTCHLGRNWHGLCGSVSKEELVAQLEKGVSRQVFISSLQVATSPALVPF